MKIIIEEENGERYEITFEPSGDDAFEDTYGMFITLVTPDGDYYEGDIPRLRGLE